MFQNIVKIPCEVCGEPFSIYEVSEHELLCQGSSNEKSTKRNTPQMKDFVPKNYYSPPNNNNNMNYSNSSYINKFQSQHNDGNNNAPDNSDNSDDSDADSNDNNTNSDDMWYQDETKEQVNDFNTPNEVNNHYNNYKNDNNGNINNYSNNNFNNMNSKFANNKLNLSQKQLSGNGPPITIVALGNTGCGKSTALNRLSGDISEDGNQGPFRSAGGGTSVTQAVQSMNNKFNYKQLELKQLNGQSYQIIDTPGLADSEGNEEKLVNEMKKFFQSTCYGVNIFIVCVNVTNTRYDKNVQNALRLLSELFGKGFWDHVMIVFTRHDKVSNKYVNGKEYDLVSKQWSDRIKKQFELNNNMIIPMTGIGKNNYVNAIKDIIKVCKTKGVFSCKYMKSWKEAGGIGNPKERLKKEKKLLDTITKQKTQFDKEIKKLKKEFNEKKDKQKKEIEDWKKQLQQVKDSKHQINELKRQQNLQNQKLKNQIQQLQQQAKKKKKWCLVM